MHVEMAPQKHFVVRLLEPRRILPSSFQSGQVENDINEKPKKVAFGLVSPGWACLPKSYRC